MNWQGDHASPTFEMDFGGMKNDDDWEDWLRWDPGANTTVRDDDISYSGSSKNDSPVQKTAFAVAETHLVNLGETLAPPLVVGEDDLDNSNIFGQDVFSFGGDHTVDNTFSFDTFNNNNNNTNLSKSAIAEHDWSVAPNAGLLPPLHTSGEHMSPASGSQTATTPSFRHSPASSAGPRTSLSSHPSPDPPKKRGGRKRKVEPEPELDNDNGDSQDGDEPPVKKTSHNVIEKRYRNNLNDKIVELRNSVPSLRALGRAKGQNNEDLEGLTPAHKHNKATIMAKATEYIQHLEKRNKTMQDEMDALKAKLSSVEAAFNRTRSRQGSIVGSPPSGTIRPRELSATTPVGGMHNFLGVSQPYQQQYLQQNPPTYARQPNPPVEAQNTPAARKKTRGNLTNKLMLGGMAGLMMMEGMNTDGDTSNHGLSMLPGMNLLKRADLETIFPTSAIVKHPLLPLIKVFLIISTLLYLIMPLFSWSNRQKQPVRPTIRLPQAPSLASPVEVRRKAWSTAIRTVWVPKHFLLEVVSVLSKMFKMFVRRIVGTELFASIIGANKDDEAARIKAWDIAIDAQLAGGDAEVSYYHLLLTLMASGTLPDSPTRLMQKAVHFRVFFWEVANAGYGNLVMFKQFTEKVGRFYWESARRLQKELAQNDAHTLNGEAVDPLPDHLAGLLELECDDVLSDEMIQRAWNLAWNKPSANGLVANAPRDSVVMDHAIRSPMDAVAAWYSNMLVDETITETFGSTASKIDMEYYLNLAISIAPPASSTQARALATKAVLSRANKTINITSALDALPGTAQSNHGMNLVDHGPASPEVRTALTMAKLVSLYPKTSAAPAARANVGEMLARFSMPPQSFTLLTAVASYQLLETYSRSRILPFAAAQGLEDLACSLRIWIGTTAAHQAGLDDQERAEIVERCLEVAKIFGGWDGQDSGYGSHAVSKEGSPVQEVADTRSVMMG
ncbi:hypothetical protein AMS68_001150 [Peltaster fructicola]|uniref:BHLH domain-containing protein n=1 Tax=Peltaster fructicola TaxID=286661 RepID=A0A6H0XLP1_9PEZI|nr:hypothetical protein AMS68_001150 [Peltaster fructicola]